MSANTNRKHSNRKTQTRKYKPKHISLEIKIGKIQTGQQVGKFNPGKSCREVHIENYKTKKQKRKYKLETKKRKIQIIKLK